MKNRLTRWLAPLAAAAAFALLSAPAVAAEPLKSTDDRIILMRAPQPAEETLFALEQSITNNGLVIDYHSHFGEMLDRTRADVGSDKVVYKKADILVFCSARLSRLMVESDITAIAHCPYTMFVFERPEEPGASYIGYRRVWRQGEAPSGPAGEIDGLLEKIARDAGAE